MPYAGMKQCIGPMFLSMHSLAILTQKKTKEKASLNNTAVTCVPTHPNETFNNQ